MDIKNWFKSKKREKKIPEFVKEFAFTDLDGVDYYRFAEPTKLPLERYAKSIDILLWMSAGITDNELISLVERMESEMENLVTGKKGSLSKIGVICNELKLRAGMIVHHELLYQLMAVYYVIDGENLNVINDELNDRKIQAFKKLVAEKGVYDFFQVPELSELNKRLFSSPSEFQTSWNDSIRAVTRTKKMLEYLKSDAKLEQDGKILRAN